MSRPPVLVSIFFILLGISAVVFGIYGLLNIEGPKSLFAVMIVVGILWTGGAIWYGFLRKPPPVKKSIKPRKKEARTIIVGPGEAEPEFGEKVGEMYQKRILGPEGKIPIWTPTSY